MSSDSSSESTPYRLPRGRRRVIVASSSCTAGASTSEATLETKLLIATGLDPLRTPCSEVLRQSKFLILIRYIAISLHVLEGSYGFSSKPSLHISAIREGGPQLSIGKGKTFYVSKMLLPKTVQFKQSWPSKLVLQVQRPLFHSMPGEYRGDVITSKRPLLEFDSYGNPIDGAAEQRLKAVISEIKVLTHPPLYLHKNIVDFLGINWECDLSDFEPGQTIAGPTKRIPSILLEYAQHGSLADFRNTTIYASMSFDERARLCRDVAEGLAAMHRCNIVHGDVKLDNILIFDGNVRDGGMAFGFRAKLADFGFSVIGCRCCDQSTGEGASWRLRGRTWPWNDPEWNLPRTLSQLQKTDVFSYGLLAWTILTGKELGSLFDLEGENISKNDPNMREMVEKLKDWTLGWNAANYFRGGDRLVELLVECLFGCSLNPVAEERGTMKDILEIWNTWFIGETSYQPLPPGMSFGQAEIEDGDRVQFQGIVRYMSEFPPVIKQQFLSLYGDPSICMLERFEAAIFHAFAYLIGWGIEQNLEAGKRLIDEAAENSPNAALFQPMFFEPGRTPMGYVQKVFNRLVHQSHTLEGDEVFPQLYKYFLRSSGRFYAILRSKVYRQQIYGIKACDYPVSLQKEAGAELSVCQQKDIELNSLRETVLLRGHNQLHFAVFSGFTEAINEILESEDFDPRLLEEGDYNGDTPLLAACRQGRFRTAELLIQAGADVKAVNYWNEATLHFLTEFQNPKELAEISNLILALGGKELIHLDCTRRSYRQEPIMVMPHMRGPPLNSAVLRGNLELVRIFLEHGADPCNGATTDSPLELAALGHFTEILKLFWEVVPEAREWRDCTLVMHAIMGFNGFQRMYLHSYRTKEMMESTFDFLLDKAFSTGSPTKIQDFPLLNFAAQRGSVEILEHIISRIGTAGINAYHGGYTPLHETILCGSNEKFELLLKYGADPHSTVGDLTPLPSLYLFSIFWGGTKQMIEYLVEQGVGKGDDGRFPQIFTGAISSYNLEMASLLLDVGADIDEVDKLGWTVLGSVIRSCTENSVAQMKFLLDHQAAIGKKPASFLVIPRTGATALHMVASTPRTSPSYDRNTMSSVLDYLLDKFCSPEHLNAQDNGGHTALHYAASYGNLKVVQRLLEFDTIDLDLRASNNGMTAYECAMAYVMQGIPTGVRELGHRAVERYKRDGLEVRRLLGEKHSMEVGWVDTGFEDFSSDSFAGGINYSTLDGVPMDMKTLLEMIEAGVL